MALDGGQEDARHYCRLIGRLPSAGCAILCSGIVKDAVDG